MYDVVIVGAGPAGSVAATVLARAGARVCLIDRATFPREKLCGDTLNPGALATLRRLKLAAVADSRGLKVDGMVVTGEGGIAIEGRYPRHLHGRAITRAEFDVSLVREAVAAGVEFIPGVPIRTPIVTNGSAAMRIEGVASDSNGTRREFRAPVTIAADGRHSTLAFALGLAASPARPRRWAIGAYAENVPGLSVMGEMHIRRGCYIGVAPVPGGLTNVCLVKPSGGADPSLHSPLAALQAALSNEPLLRDRFAGARFLGRPVVMGPLAVDVVETNQIPEGLLLAGDAAGFIDPMTGDGLRFAISGGELAAGAALRALEHGWDGVQDRLAANRRRDFAAKWRLNRTLRRFVASPLAVRAATAAAHVAPGIIRALVLRASDCDLAEQGG